MLNLIKRTNTI